MGAPPPPPNPPNPPPRCARAVAASATIPTAASARVNPFGLIAPHSFLAFELANGPGFHGQVDEELLHLLLVLRRVHPGLAQLQLANLIFERALLLDERPQRRVRDGRRSRRPAPVGFEKKRRGELALVAVVERRMLGEDEPLLFVRLGDLGAGVLEGFEDRYAAVAIAVGGVVFERFHEIRREAGLVSFAAGFCRRDDGAARSCAGRQETGARAGRLHEG